MAEHISTAVAIESIPDLSQKYFKVIDKVSIEIQRRFNQAGMEAVIRLEGILIDSVKIIFKQTGWLRSTSNAAHNHWHAILKTLQFCRF